MYERRNSVGNRYGNNSRSGGHSRYGGGSGGGNRYSRNDRGRRGQGGGGGRFSGEKISHNRYVAKAQDVGHSTTYVTDIKYSDFDLVQLLKTNLVKKNYIYPTKVQSQAIPNVIAGNDILATASTGSGKTAAFLIPIINRAMKDKTTKCLIITPTRELAGQIKNEFDLFALGAGLRRVLVIGGENIRRQTYELRDNPQFIIGTPGRLKDLFERNHLKLGLFNVVVLDEVDRMLDMGFVADIKMLISKLNQTRQSLFFSATMTSAAEQIANSLLTEPVKITTEAQSPIKNVEQDVVKVTGQGKVETLHGLLIKDEFRKVLVFSKTKRGADSLTKELQTRGFKADTIHGNKSQHKRSKALASFRKGEIKILVATDVAARGIDVPDITHVINYDEPATYSDYIHRIGRTGRIGKKGVALTFVR
ncbi:hypothetical protein A2886_02780 [candidate division WWE3 bacterium RIFCSPHIGHO2_01_FULL_42_13]|uniref:DEAD/DEAH box helicase n=1 Tax=candidate division WWE3 bacterium RIFCSPHIGHO2_01_FULL_42_13 TaxID=1802617 RepID=A0A1F4URR5_UNCKA|nr:MAG: hypothetical protein A2886_02780 [candidate division WWE3 bacterium RIFCSPHIGHO2_01_FULL_42_13]